ncbi:hypothetical protein HRG84_16750 [Flavisolibacter sp. BT320]|nr:hypothetical protein [Flavisolibacter longurius]
MNANVELLEVKSRKYLGYKFAFISIITLISCRLFTYDGISDRSFDIAEIIVSALLITIVIFYLKSKHLHQATFSSNIFLFVVLPFLSVFSAGIFHDQALQHSLLLLKTIVFWLLYYVLHIYNVPTKWVINLMVVIGVIWIVITVMQQFTYPVYHFYTRNEEDGSILRAGVYRFFIEPKNYCLFIILFYYDKFLKSKKVVFILMTLLGLIGYYYLGARQYAVSAFVCMILASVIQKGSKRVFAILLILFVSIILYALQDILLESYIEMTNEQLQDDDDIRILAAKFFLFEYWPHWLAVIFGNGEGHSYNSYGQELEKISKNLGYYKSDIGLIGALNTYGLVYIFSILIFYYKAIFTVKLNSNSNYLKLIIFNFFILSLLSFEFTLPSSIIFFCFIFYLMDKSKVNSTIDNKSE